MRKVVKCIIVGLAVVMLALITGNVNGTVAHAESTKSKDAKKAYYKFLSKKEIPWYDTWYGEKKKRYIPAKYCKFDIGDINNDGMPELYVYSYTSEYYMGRILTCKYNKDYKKKKKDKYSVVPFKVGGKEYLIGNMGLQDGFSSHPSYYKGKNIIMFKKYHSSKYISYYSTKSTKMTALAEWEDSWQPGMDRSHSKCITYWLKGKETSKKSYEKQVKKLIGKAKKVTFSPKSNTSKNRKKYL